MNTVDSIRLAQESHTSIGEVLDKEPGVAKRSFGPGSARPVMRGFDGDRVLVPQDGASHRRARLAVGRPRRAGRRALARTSRSRQRPGHAALRQQRHRRRRQRRHGARLRARGHGAATSPASAARRTDRAARAAALEYGTGKWMLWGNGTRPAHGRLRHAARPRRTVLHAQSPAASAASATTATRASSASPTATTSAATASPSPPFFETGGEETGSDVSIKARRHNLKFNGGWRDLKAASSTVSA